MTKHITLSACATLLLVAHGTHAAQIFSSSFTNGEGFSESTTINGVGGFASQAGVISVDVAGGGEVQYVPNNPTNPNSANFLRAIAPSFDSLGVSSFNPGDVIEVTTQIRAVGGNTPGFDANIFHFGITDDSDLGTTAPDVGANLGAGNNGLWDIADQSGGGKTDTAFMVDNTTTRLLVTTITKSATPGDFDVVNTLDGESFVFAVTNLDVYNAATADIFPTFRGQGQLNVGGIAVESFAVDFTPIPEPTAVGTLALGLLAVGARRRRS
ncbi:MAG: PEP-CTERM sorting domain-containing protein [Planctomycetota bacterium]